MIPPDPLAAYQAAPLADLLAILLRQFRRPLVSRGVHFTDADAEKLAGEIVAHGELSEISAKVRAALVDLVAESYAALERWNLTFQQSLDTEMSDIPGWETTADFLVIANEKTNAELRISTGAALLAALGDPRYEADLRFLAARPDDLDGVIARRVLEWVGSQHSS